MNALRRLVSDLVEKRLWPVALMLVLTAVAIPLLIGGGGDAGSTAPDPAIDLAPAAVSATPAVELVGPPAVRSRPGPVRDPFRRSAKAAEKSGEESATLTPSTGKSAATTSSSKTTAASGSAKSGSGSTTAAVRAKAKSKAKSTTDPAITLASRSAYQTVVRFTRPAGARERALYRLSVLGNAANPALQFLGVGDDGEYAIFLLGPKATTAGDDGACVVADGCRVIGLRQGDKLGVDVAGAGTTSRHYVVEITRVRRMTMTSAPNAAAWRRRVDPIGRAVLRTIRADVATAAAASRMRFSSRTGTVGLRTAS